MKFSIKTNLLILLISSNSVSSRPVDANPPSIPIQPNNPTPPNQPSAPNNPGIIDVYDEPKKKIINDNVLDLDSSKYVLIPKERAKELDDDHREGNTQHIVIESASSDDDYSDDDDDYDGEKRNRHHHRHKNHDKHDSAYNCDPFGYGEELPCRPFPTIGLNPSTMPQYASAPTYLQPAPQPTYLQSTPQPTILVETNVNPQPQVQQVAQPQVVTLSQPQQVVVPSAATHQHSQQLMSQGPLISIV